MAEHIVEFLQRGVQWIGLGARPPTPAEADLLIEIAFRTRVNGGPIKVPLKFLGSKGGREYSERHIKECVVGLTKKGLITRLRAQRAAGARREGPAETQLNPALVAAATRWRAERQDLRNAGRRGAATYPNRIAFELPMSLPTSPLTVSPDPEGANAKPKNVSTADFAQNEGAPSKPNVDAGCKGDRVRKSHSDLNLQGEKFAPTGIHTPQTARERGGTCLPRIALERMKGESLKGEEGSPRGGQPCLSTPARSAGVGKCVVVHGLEDGEDASSLVSAERERRSLLLSTPMAATAGMGGGAPVNGELLSAEPSLGALAGVAIDCHASLPESFIRDRPTEELGRAELAMRARSSNSTRLAMWIMKQNGANRDHLTRLMTIRCTSDGRYSGGELQIGKYSEIAQSTGKYSGLSVTKWDELFRAVHARDRKTSKGTSDYIGESLFAGPREGSRIVLLDDVGLAMPLFNGFACAVLETSIGNFQHLYACDRDLMHEERHRVQRALYEGIGRKSDGGALSGHQAHRWPGSVNLKPDRKRFWTRLVYLGDGKKIDVARLLASSLRGSIVPNAATPQKEKVSKVERPRLPSLAAGPDKTASGRDWGLAIGMLKRGGSVADVEAFLHTSVRQPARRQRDEGVGCEHYVRTTIAALRAHGFLREA